MSSIVVCYNRSLRETYAVCSTTASLDQVLRGVYLASLHHSITINSIQVGDVSYECLVACTQGAVADCRGCRLDKIGCDQDASRAIAKIAMAGNFSEEVFTGKDVE